MSPAVPVERSPVGRPGQVPLRGEGRGASRVLVVDDDASLRELLAEVLGAEGYEVVLAADGVEALELLGGAEGAPAVILTDTLMPRMGGWDLIRAYRALPPPHAPIISMGFGAQVALASAGRAASDRGGLAVDAELEKPFDLDQLLALIAAFAARGGAAPPAG